MCVCVCSCAQVSCWGGGHEEAGQRSGTRVWQTIDGAPSTPGKTYTSTDELMFTLIPNHNTTDCKSNLTDTGVILFLTLCFIHRISRALKTKRISNHRDTAQNWLRVLFVPRIPFPLITLGLCILWIKPPAAIFVAYFNNFLLNLNWAGI